MSQTRSYFIENELNPTTTMVIRQKFGMSLESTVLLEAAAWLLLRGKRLNPASEGAVSLSPDRSSPNLESCLYILLLSTHFRLNWTTRMELFTKSGSFLDKMQHVQTLQIDAGLSNSFGLELNLV